MPICVQWKKSTSEPVAKPPVSEGGHRVTEKEWDAMVADFKKTLDKFMRLSRPYFEDFPSALHKGKEI